MELLGVPLDPRSTAESIAEIFAAFDHEEGCTHVVTLNPEYVMAARRDPAFLAAIGRADLILADGAGVVAAARLLGVADIGRLTGVEIVERLADRGVPLFLLGAKPGIAEATSAKLLERSSDARIADFWSDGSPDRADDDESIRRIVASGAGVIAVAYGAEGQVHWIDRNQARLDTAGVRLAVGVGGSFDYISGAVARPPGFVRRAGLEWLWRLVREPWRWRRQLALPQFALLVISARIRQGFKR